MSFDDFINRQGDIAQSHTIQFISLNSDISLTIFSRDRIDFCLQLFLLDDLFKSHFTYFCLFDRDISKQERLQGKRLIAKIRELFYFDAIGCVSVIFQGKQRSDGRKTRDS